MGARTSPRAPKALVAGELVRFDGNLWRVSSVFDTNLEGKRANLTRETEQGTDRCTVPFQECEVV